MITIENLTCGYDDRTVWENLSFEAHRGEITAIIAPSGGGKTTLLKAINRLHEVEQSGFWMRGSVQAKIGERSYDVYSSSIDPHWLRRRIAYIFQSPVMLPMSIEANVAFGLKLSYERDKETIRLKVSCALEEAALWEEVHDRLDQPADTLSLGQKQRLAIARALVLEPEIFLLDEPTSSLDPEATLRVEALMQRLKKERTLLLVSHDQEQIERVADRAVLL